MAIPAKKLNSGGLPTPLLPQSATYLQDCANFQCTTEPGDTVTTEPGDTVATVTTTP